MAARFLIVNNGMTEARGHYPETGVAVAGAARARGFEVTMGVHVRCRGRGDPDGPPMLPVFRVDHWGHVVDRGPGARARLARFARRLLPTGLFDKVRAISRTRRGLPAKPWAEGGAVAGAPAASGDPEERLRQALGAIPPDHDEFAHYRAFGADLERFLARCTAGPGDHVFFPTAHGRDAAAVLALVARTDTQRLPTFHLEFRHAILSPAELRGAPNPFAAFYTRTHEAYFRACRACRASSRVRFYTDTPELAYDYAALAGFPFAVLPVPFRAGLIPPAPRRTEGGAIRVLFLGDLRREKGFTRLPALVRALRAGGNRVRFVIPGAIHPEERGPEMLAALAELEAEQVERPHPDGFIPPEEYYRLLASADVVLCPYDARAYRARSSGVFAEAVAAGKPTVVPVGTWMAAEQEPGAGEAYADDADLLRAVRRVCTDLPTYCAAAETARADWLAQHNPAALLDRLLDERADRSRARSRHAEAL